MGFYFLLFFFTKIVPQNLHKDRICPAEQNHTFKAALCRFRGKKKNKLFVFVYIPVNI